MIYKSLPQFYTGQEWRKFRLNLILERGNKCQRCGKTFKDSYLVGHHKEPLTIENVNDVNISLNPNNVDIICSKCHNEIENRFGAKKQVFIIWGSPLSGKNTLVNQLAHRNDLIVDIDKIYECISNNSRYDKSDSIKQNVFAVYNLLIDNIKTRLGNWNNAYVIGGLSNPSKRERLQKDLGAELIYIESTKEECICRLYQDEERIKYQDQWLKYIEEWWEEYERYNNITAIN